MSLIPDLILRLAFWLLLAPLLPGLINKVKAWVAGRRGPPVLQLYYDLAKLWRKGVVMSQLASPGFVIGPAVAWVALIAAALLMPLGPGGSLVSFRGDVLLMIYLLALARFCTAWAALETGSAFEGMGAAREVSYAVLAEAAIIAAVLSLIVHTGSVSLLTLLSPSAGAGAALLAAGLFLVLLAENCRVPFDDPNTHLELTMIHEVMALDHSGPPLAAILHGASVKLLLFSILLVQAVLPIGAMSPIPAAGVLAAGVLTVTVSVGLVESLLARLAFRRVPLLLTTAFLLCLFALLVAWKGGRPMSGALNLLIGLAMGLNLLALGSSRLPSLIRAMSVQGMLLGVMPLLLEHERFDWRILLVAVATITGKGVLIPGLLRRAMRAANVEREIEPFIGFVPSLLLGAGGTIAAVALARALPLLPEHVGLLLVPGALASILTGFILLIGRAKAVSQVCGYLILENGIYLFGLLLIHSTPLLVESGILLDVTGGVFIIGIIVDRIQRAFDSLDTRKLNTLRE